MPMPQLSKIAVVSVNRYLAAESAKPVLQVRNTRLITSNHQGRYIYHIHYYFISCDCPRCQWSLVYVPDCQLNNHMYPIELGARL